MTCSDLPSQPLLRSTPMAAAASPENMLPPHNQNQGIVLCLPAQRKKSAETRNLQTIATTPPPRNLTSPGKHLDINANRDALTSRDPPNQPLSPRTLVATAASPKNQVPPRNRNQTSGGIILCLPAQRKNSAETVNLQITATTVQPKKLTSPLTASTSGVEGKQTRKKRKFGTNSPLANLYSVGNTGVPSQINLSIRPKELPSDDIQRMLMGKARTGILSYLND